MIQVVDDGSGDDQQAWLKLWLHDLGRQFTNLLPPILNPVNHGKGGAVYSGWNSAEGDFKWLAFVDADGAISPEEVVRLLRGLEETSDDAVWAVRTGEQGTLVRRDFKRKLFGQAFRKLVRKLFQFPLPDTQCGFKMIKADRYRQVASGLEEQGFCFDIELTFQVLRAGGRISAEPIHWDESPDSRLKPKNVLGMLRTILALKKRLGNWDSQG